MKKILKSRLFLVIITSIICISTTVYATTQYLASQISYTKSNNETITLDTALDELYSASLSSGARVCEYVGNVYGNSNNHLSLGTEYECDVNLSGQNKKNFYVLKVKGDTVTLIAKQNVTQGSSKTMMTWAEALQYVRALNWKIAPDLPSVQDIVDAVGNTSWKVENKSNSDWFCFGGNFSQACSNGTGALKDDANTIKNRWLFNYTRSCGSVGCDTSTSLGESEAFGYWTKSIVVNLPENATKNQAWYIGRSGSVSYVNLTSNNSVGVRPVITLLKSNLYE